MQWCSRGGSWGAPWWEAACWRHFHHQPSTELIPRGEASAQYQLALPWTGPIFRKTMSCAGCECPRVLLDLSGRWVRLDTCDKARFEDLCPCCHWDQPGVAAGSPSPVPRHCHLCSGSWAAWGGINQRSLQFLCQKQNQHLRMFKFSFHRDKPKGKEGFGLFNSRVQPRCLVEAYWTMVPGWWPGEADVCFSRWVMWQLRWAALHQGAEVQAVDWPSAPLAAVPCPRAGGVEEGVERWQGQGGHICRWKRVELRERGSTSTRSLVSCPHPAAGGWGQLGDFPEAFGPRSLEVSTSTRMHGKLSTGALSKTSFASAWEWVRHALRGGKRF